MGRIIILDEHTSNRIAAGEVIERPASVVKELVENSIDAGATSISVEIKKGGISLIKVSDNGSGIAEDDAEIAFERHATSKIRKPNDLDSISTLGFRGEALASIAAVAKIQLTTRVIEKPYGIYAELNGGITKEIRQVGCPVGTTFIVRDLFFNTPARYKFLKKDSTEAGHISDVITRIAVGNPHISFKLVNNGYTVIHTPGNNHLLSTVFSLYGKDIAKKTSKIQFKDENVLITGYAGSADTARSNRNYQSFYVNSRYIKSKTITSAVDEAYKTFLMKNKFPFIVLKIEINPLQVDVNVHPAKMEVRFSNDREVFSSVYHAVRSAITRNNSVRSVLLSNKKGIEYLDNPPDKTDMPGIEYKQQDIDIKTFLREDPYSGNKPKANNIHNKNNYYENTNNIKDLSISPEKKIDDRGEENTGEKDNKLAKESCNIGLLSNARIIGQVFSTYIILQSGEDMVLIDQHAAHERIIFEELKKKYSNDVPLSQDLISPVVIELTQHEIKLLEGKKDFFRKIGFDFDNFGNNSIILRSVPYQDKGSTIREAFLEIMDGVLNTDNIDVQSIAEDALYRVACKAAIKANKKLNETEILKLIADLGKFRNPYTCPHGRPTIIKIAKYELEKKFKRV
jgi:DNA mismatch repair protein MutL